MLPFGRWWSRASRLENSLAAIISLNFTSFHFLLYGKEKFIFLDSRATSLLVVYCLGHPILESDEAFLFPPREGLMTFRWRRATLFRPISFRLISMGKHLRTSTMKSTNSNDRKCIPFHHHCSPSERPLKCFSPSTSSFTSAPVAKCK